MRPFAYALLALLAASPALAQTTAPTSEPPSDGIHITGHWTLDVRDADGSLDDSVQFTNDLVNSGAEFLMDLFTREVAFGALSLHISGEEGPCQEQTGDRFRCIIAEPNSNGRSDAITKNLEFEVIQRDAVVLAW
ncbi:MAG: hypothetical protein AAF845_15600 [Bacteroidota bacterium]